MAEKTGLRKKYIVGNWKMNPTSASDAKKIWNGLAARAGKFGQTEAIICPPTIFMGLLGKKGKLKLGGQDAFYELEGAHTGSISPSMLKSLGAEYVIIGHSEKRKGGDTDEIINKKIKTALKEGLKVIFCVGEEVRDEKGEYLKELTRQIAAGLAGVPRQQFGNLLLAHEPVWAIGAAAKGADSPAGFEHNRLFIKKVLADLAGKKTGLAVPILYGGSANAGNAGAFLHEAGADGLLVGRASLSPIDFAKIIEIAN